jgi:hypothetical protein
LFGLINGQHEDFDKHGPICFRLFPLALRLHNSRLLPPRNGATLSTRLPGIMVDERCQNPRAVELPRRARDKMARVSQCATRR